MASTGKLEGENVSGTEASEKQPKEPVNSEQEQRLTKASDLAKRLIPQVEGTPPQNQREAEDAMDAIAKARSTLTLLTNPLRSSANTGLPTTTGAFRSRTEASIAVAMASMDSRKQVRTENPSNSTPEQPRTPAPETPLPAPGTQRPEYRPPIVQQGTDYGQSVSTINLNVGRETTRTTGVSSPGTERNTSGMNPVVGTRLEPLPFTADIQRARELANAVNIGIAQQGESNRDPLEPPVDIRNTLSRTNTADQPINNAPHTPSPEQNGYQADEDMTTGSVQLPETTSLQPPSSNQSNEAQTPPFTLPDNLMTRTLTRPIEAQRYQSTLDNFLFYDPNNFTEQSIASTDPQQAVIDVKTLGTYEQRAALKRLVEDNPRSKLARAVNADPELLALLNNNKPDTPTVPTGISNSEPITTILPDEQPTAHLPIPSAPPIPADHARPETFSPYLNKATTNIEPSTEHPVTNFNADNVLQRRITETIPDQAVLDVKTLGADAETTIIEMARNNPDSDLYRAVLADPDLGPRLKPKPAATTPQQEPQDNNPQKPPDTSPTPDGKVDAKKANNSPDATPSAPLDKNKVKQTFTTTSGKTFTLSIEDAMRLGVELPSDQASDKTETIDKIYESIKDRLNELERTKPDVPPNSPVPSTNRKRFGLSRIKQRAGQAWHDTRDYFSRSDDLSGVSQDGLSGQARTLLEQQAAVKKIDLTRSAPATPEPGDGKSKGKPDNTADQQQTPEPAKPLTEAELIAALESGKTPKELEDEFVTKYLASHPDAGKDKESLMAVVAAVEERRKAIHLANIERNKQKEQANRPQRTTKQRPEMPEFIKTVRLKGAEKLKEHSFNSKTRAVARASRETKADSRRWIAAEKEVVNTKSVFNQAHATRVRLESAITITKQQEQILRGDQMTASRDIARAEADLQVIQRRKNPDFSAIISTRADQTDKRPPTEDEIRDYVDKRKEALDDAKIRLQEAEEKLAQALAEREEDTKQKNQALREEKSAKIKLDAAEREVKAIEQKYSTAVIEDTKDKQKSTADESDQDKKKAGKKKELTPEQKKKKEEEEQEKARRKQAAREAFNGYLKRNLGVDLDNAKPEDIEAALAWFMNDIVGKEHPAEAERVNKELKKLLNKDSKKATERQKGKTNILLEVLLQFMAAGVNLGIGEIEALKKVTTK